MRLLCVGDLHGNTDLLLRLLDDDQLDGLLCVGDWGDPGQIIGAVWDTLLERVPILTVFGNHDDLGLLPTLRNHQDDSPVLLSPGEQRSFCGLTVAGVSGIWAKSHRLPYYVTDEEVAVWSKTLAASAIPTDILLTHGCPIGIADKTLSGRPGGQRCFLQLLQAVKPRVHLCGHLHVAQRQEVGQPPCLVLNTGTLMSGSYALLERDSDGTLRIDLRQTNP